MLMRPRWGSWEGVSQQSNFEKYFVFTHSWTIDQLHSGSSAPLNILYLLSFSFLSSLPPFCAIYPGRNPYLVRGSCRGSFLLSTCLSWANQSERWAWPSPSTCCTVSLQGLILSLSLPRLSLFPFTFIPLSLSLFPLSEICVLSPVRCMCELWLCVPGVCAVCSEVCVPGVCMCGLQWGVCLQCLDVSVQCVDVYAVCCDACSWSVRVLPALKRLRRSA